MNNVNFKKQNFRIQVRKSKTKKSKSFNTDYNSSNKRLLILKYKLTPFCKHVGLSPECFYLTLAIFDRLTSEFAFNNQDLEELCFVILSLVVKLKESRKISQVVDSLIDSIIQSKAKMANFEKMILQALNFDMNVVTSFDLLQSLLQIEDSSGQVAVSDLALFKKTAFKLLHYSSFDYSTNQFESVPIVLGILMTVRKMFNCSVIFPIFFKKSTGFAEGNLNCCFRFMSEMLQK
ncbi:MAG: hypothetical protein AAF206_24650, partial [Bacteroidota bacterium]